MLIAKHGAKLEYWLFAYSYATFFFWEKGEYVYRITEIIQLKIWPNFSSSFEGETFDDKHVLQKSFKIDILKLFHSTKKELYPDLKSNVQICNWSKQVLFWGWDSISFFPEMLIHVLAPWNEKDTPWNTKGNTLVMANLSIFLSI